MPFGQAAPSMNGLDQLTAGMNGLQAGLSSLFDPSKVAHAGYMGAEARRAMLQGDQITNQLNMQGQVLGRLGAMAPQGGNFAPLRPGAPQVYQPAGDAYLPGAAPPWAGGAAPAQPPPQGAPSAPAPLSATIMGPTPGGSLPMMDTATVGQTLSPGDSAMNTGQQPPPASPPSPGAPPAPNTTASNGTVPATDGRLHPGSIQAPGGGVKMSGPASPNGSPAPPIDLGPLMATALMAGMDAASAANLTRAYVNDVVRHGVLDQATANQILEPVQSMVTTEAARQFNNQPYVVGVPGDPTQSRVTTQAQAPGQTAYDSQRANTIITGQQETAKNARTPVSYITKDGTVGRRPYGEVVKLPDVQILSDAQVQELEKPVNVYDANGKVRSIPTWQAQKEQRTLVPGSMDQAQGQAAGYGGGAAVAEIQPPPAATAEQEERASQNRQVVLNQRYTPQPGYPVRDIARVQLSGLLSAKVDALARKYYADTKNRATYQKDAAAYSQALDDLTASGEIPTPNQVFRPQLYDFIKNNVVPINGEKTLLIDESMMPKLSETVTPNNVPQAQGNNMTPTQMYGGTTAPAPAAPAAPAPAAPAPTASGGRAIGRAPPGTPDGPVMGRDGKPMGVNRGGVIYQ